MLNNWYRSILERVFWQYRGMSWRVAVYVPATNGSKTISNTQYVREALSKFSQLFGGSSATPVKGAWLSDNDGLVLENTVIVYSFTKTLNVKDRRAVLDYAESIKRNLNQESVAVEFTRVKGGLYLL